MAVGLPLKTTYADGDVYSASDVNDTNGTINITAAPYAAGKNKIINGDFFVNQRNFTSTTTSATFGFDRFYLQRGGGGTVTYSAQTFTPGTAPVAGYEAANFARLVTTSQSASSDYSLIRQKIENVRSFAGQTVTVSAWIKAGSNGQLANFSLTQDFGSGGSSETAMKGANLTLTTSWVRYTTTFSVPSLSGKTIGTGSSLSFYLWSSAGSDLTSYSDIGNQNATIDLWGVQVEASSIATAFQTATGTIQGELAACQRYYWRLPGTTSDSYAGFAANKTTTTAYAIVQNPVPMRTNPAITIVNTTSGWFYDLPAGAQTISSFQTSGVLRPYYFDISIIFPSASTAGFTGFLYSGGSTAYVDVSAEL
jgi:hypothetical protein